MSKSSVVDKGIITSLKEIMGDAFSMLINTFIDDTGKLIQSMPELQQQNDLDVFTRNAHSIKSSSANVGALQLSSIAADLEAMGKNGDISDSKVQIEALINEFNATCIELNDL